MAIPGLASVSVSPRWVRFQDGLFQTRMRRPVERMGSPGREATGRTAYVSVKTSALGRVPLSPNDTDALP